MRCAAILLSLVVGSAPAIAQGTLQRVEPTARDCTDRLPDELRATAHAQPGEQAYDDGVELSEVRKLFERGAMSDMLECLMSLPEAAPQGE